MVNKKIVLLAGKGVTTNILYHALNKNFTIDSIILEESVSKKELLKKRTKHLGFGKVCGQVLFQILIAKVLYFFSAKRRKEIAEKFNLNKYPLPGEKLILIKSVNNDTCIAALQHINPAIVVVIGTRIITKKVLDCIGGKFLNIHCGITPGYRNVHGAYWALAKNDPENCGVTVHLVDAGIDTGRIIYQRKISITSKDNFVTYPLLQLAEGITCLKKAIDDILKGKLILKEGTTKSKIWYHPTFRQYIYHRVINHTK